MAASGSLAKIFKAYDVRGRVPDEIDPPIAYAIGRGFGRLCAAEGSTRVVVARDMRPSGVALSRSLIAGLLAEGLAVVDVGLASTDLCYFASGHLDAPGAMLTASHNPAQYNGIKFCHAGARPIGQDSGLATIRALAEEALADTPADGGLSALNPASFTTMDLLPAFADHVRSFVDIASLRPLAVVADTANGMGGLVAPAVFAGLPFSLDVLFGELDGTFPNHPADPLQPENIVALQARVRASGADIGLAFDGDADRVFLVDERGEGLSGSTTTAIVAAAMLERHPGATILYNCICSKAVPEVIREHGGVPVRTRVGHSFIKAVMAETGAVFGGEHSGHYYFRDNYRADSGIIAALVVLQALSSANVPLSELRVPYERYADSGELNTEVKDPAAALAAVESFYRAAGGEIDHLDGLTVDLGSWWFNLRSSNTEPLLRLNVEADQAFTLDGHVKEVLSMLEAPTVGTGD